MMDGLRGTCNPYRIVTLQDDCIAHNIKCSMYVCRKKYIHNITCIRSACGWIETRSLGDDDIGGLTCRQQPSPDQTRSGQGQNKKICWELK